MRSEGEFADFILQNLKLRPEELERSSGKTSKWVRETGDMDREHLENAVQAGASIIDLRPVKEFVQEHLVNSIFISFSRRTLLPVLRACIAPRSPVVVVVANEIVAAAACKLIVGVGEYRVVGTLATGVAGIGSIGYPTDSLEVIRVSELASRLAKPESNFTLVDVREPFEWKLGYIEGSMLLSLKDIRVESDRWRAGEEVIFICEEGLRSTTAASLLKKDGIRTVKSVKGGIAEWFSSGLPLKEE